MDLTSSKLNNKAEINLAIKKNETEYKAIIEDEQKTITEYQNILNHEIVTQGKLNSPLPDFTAESKTKYTLYNVIREDDYELCIKLLKNEGIPMPIESEKLL